MPNFVIVDLGIMFTAEPPSTSMRLMIDLLDSIKVKIMEMNAHRRRVAKGWNTMLCPEMETKLEKSLEIGRHWDLLDSIKVKIMEMNAHRRRVAKGWNTMLCPEMETKLEKSLEIGRHWDLLDSIKVKIMEMNAHRRRVAKGWNTMLCPEMETKLEKSLEIGRHWDKCYNIPIFPIPDIDRHAQEASEEFLVNLPVSKKPLGRPRVKRIKSLGEQKRPLTCSRCGQLGRHNKTTCTIYI
ncbi:unnamed protein product [Prunus armeniaca]